MEFGSISIEKPKPRPSSKEPRNIKDISKIKESTTKQQLTIKKPSVSQDVRQNSLLMKPVGSSILVKKGNSLSKTKEKTDQPKKSKKKKLEEQKEKQRLLDEEEQEKLQEEERRRYELERFRKLQESKLTKEEKERLVSEASCEEEFQLRFEARVYFENKKRLAEEEWQNYLNCQQNPNPESEKNQSEYVYRYGEFNEITDIEKTEFYLRKSDYTETVVISDLFQHYLQNQADNKYDKMAYFDRFIIKLRSITKTKIAQITSLVINNQQKFFDEKNKALHEQDKLQITDENIRQIGSSVQVKPDERYRYEIFRTFESQEFALAFWWSPLEKCGYRMRPIEFKRPNVAIDLPRNMTSTAIYMRCLWMNYDALSPLHAASQYQILGGIYNIEAFNMLPLVKRRKKYALKMDLPEEDISKSLKYPPEISGGVLANLPSLRVQLEIRKEIFLPEKFEPRIAYFSESQGKWTEDGIDGVKYDTLLRTISFNSKMLAPFACIQDICTDFPYKRFQLRSVTEDKSVLELQTKRLNLIFEIDSENVTLLDQSNQLDNALRHLTNNPMNGGKLLLELQKIGINLIPQQSDGAFCEVTPKEVDVENKALQEVLMLVKAFAISNCPRNSKLGEDSVLFYIKQNLDYKEFAAQDSELLAAAVWCNKCAFIADPNKTINSVDPTTFLKGSSTHAMLSLVLANHPNILRNSAEAVEKMNDVFFCNFQNNLRRFLKLTRVLSFT